MEEVWERSEGRRIWKEKDYPILLPLVVATIISLCVPAISGYELLENESLIAKPIKVNLFVEK